MNRALMTVGLLMAMTSVNPVWADDTKPAAGSRATQDTKAPAGPGIYESSYKKIVQDCEVTDESNQKQLMALLKAWDADTLNVTASAAVVDPNLSQKLMSLDKELTNATEKNDARMIHDLSEKRLILLDAMGGWGSDAKQRLEDMDNKYRTAVRDFVPADKVEALDDILMTAQDSQPNRPRRGPIRSPRALKAIVDRLGDLTPEQRAGVDAAFLRHREVQRNRATRGGDETAQTKTLYDEVFAVLTDGQKTRVEQQLMGRSGAPGTPGAPVAPASSGAPAAGAKAAVKSPPAAATEAVGASDAAESTDKKP